MLIRMSPLFPVAQEVKPNSLYAIFGCMPPDSLLSLLHSREPEGALVPLFERATEPPSVAESASSPTIIRIRSDVCILRQVTAPRQVTPPPSSDNIVIWLNP